jgi:E1A-binding protein p400
LLHLQVALGSDLQQLLRIELPARDVHLAARSPGRTTDLPACLLDIVKLPERRAAEADETLRTFCCAIPKARATPPELWCSHPDTSLVNAAANRAQALTQAYFARAGLLHTARLRTQLFFPDRRLIQFDCGKLQELAVLLARLKAGGHKCLIFTQMSKMLDVLEAFLNLHAYTYVRLDGATKPEQRQILMQRFNTDPKIFSFILSTRSGGVGMNLIGADTVIFYDSDWNPAMDAQAQDRCHRIGQTREVHIYRLISEHTIEENILKKSDQKRHLDFLAIQVRGVPAESCLPASCQPVVQMATADMHASKLITTAMPELS